jgi:hypothetical protein
MNATDQTIGVSVLYSGSLHVSNFNMLPNQQWKCPAVMIRMSVTNLNGDQLFEDVVDFRNSPAVFMKPGEKIMYQLITTGGVYRVPVSFQENWRDKIDEIVELDDKELMRSYWRSYATNAGNR